MYHILPPLREYQSRAVGDVLSTAEPTCLVAPTGSGKSRMGAEIAARLPGRGAWIVHRRELLRQARDLLARHGLDDRVTPVTVQSIEWPVADFVVLDELHHYMSDEWSGIFDHLPAARFIGLTATPERADGRALGDRFSRLVVAAHYSDLLRDGFLVDCRVLRPDEVLSKGLALDPVDAYLKHGEGRAGFVFVQRVSQAKEIAERFRAQGIEARAVTERCSTAERDAAIDGLASGEVRLLVNVYTLTEGVDIPHASVCILARPVGHVSQYLQIAGRILRPCDGKQDALLIDLTGASHLHGLPTEDRIYSLDGVGIRRKSQSVTTCQLCGASYESGPTACPECGFVLPHKDWKPPRVMNVELRAVYRGAATPDDAKRREYERLRAEQRATGRSVESVVVRFRDLFGEAPNLDDVTHNERIEEYQRLTRIAAERGYKRGFAEARYKSIFGAYPRVKVQMGKREEPAAPSEHKQPEKDEEAHMVGLTEAARITGKERSTILRAIQAGRLPDKRNGMGQRVVSTQDLVRLFGSQAAEGQVGRPIDMARMVGAIEAARIAGCSRWTITRKIADGQLPCTRDERGRPLIKLSDLAMRFDIDLSRNDKPGRPEASRGVPEIAALDRLKASYAAEIERLSKLLEESRADLAAARAQVKEWQEAYVRFVERTLEARAA